MSEHESASPTRYAIYWAPEGEHPLWHAGCTWLGRDPERSSPTLEVPDTRAPYLSKPRRYGFHATLKAPFALATGCTVADLDEALARLASSLEPFALPALAVATLADFVALRPRHHRALDASHPLRRLADACVSQLDPLRAAPAKGATGHTPASSADPRAQEQENRERWGHPYVFERWRFHLSLTDPLPADAAGRVLRDHLVAEASAHFAAALAGPLACESIALFIEDAPGGDLRLARRIPFR